jgi:membrane dipeptidase
MRDHPRNIPDDLIQACARGGGVVGVNGFGLFLGAFDDNSTETLVRHIDYLTSLVGAEHVGLGLDYVFDSKEMDDDILARPDIFPPEKGYRAGLAMIEPERIPAIAEALLKRGYGDADVQGILGHNNLRVARQVWR